MLWLAYLYEEGRRLPAGHGFHQGFHVVAAIALTGIGCVLLTKLIKRWSQLSWLDRLTFILAILLL